MNESIQNELSGIYNPNQRRNCQLFHRPTTQPPPSSRSHRQRRSTPQGPLNPLLPAAPLRRARQPRALRRDNATKGLRGTSLPAALNAAGLPAAGHGARGALVDPAHLVDDIRQAVVAGAPRARRDAVARGVGVAPQPRHHQHRDVQVRVGRREGRRGRRGPARVVLRVRWERFGEPELRGVDVAVPLAAQPPRVHGRCQRVAVVRVHVAAPKAAVGADARALGRREVEARHTDRERAVEVALGEGPRRLVHPPHAALRCVQHA